MTRFLPIIIISLLLGPPLRAQDGFPSFEKVTKAFFEDYQKPVDANGIYLEFAKKKEGWYVVKKDFFKPEAPEEELYWDATSRSYRSLNGFEEPNDEEAARRNYDDFFNSNYWARYSYERCRYFGYNGWELDMMRDFGHRQNLGDTLQEGLARAYASYANGFLWDNGIDPTEPDNPYRTRLDRLEQPSDERISMAMLHIDTAIQLWKEIALRRPDYRTLVGNAAMKVFNEQMHGYQFLKQVGRDAQAQDMLRTIRTDSAIRSVARNYLEGCAPNAILFTYGDNDTYPLWYLQETGPFRRDVTVINLSLLGLPAYIHQLKKSKAVAFSSTENFYGKKEAEYIPFRKETSVNENKPVTLSVFLSSVQRMQFKTVDLDGRTNLHTPYRSVILPVNPARFNKMAGQAGLNTQFTIKPASYWLLSDVLMMDIINSNINERPIYFSDKPEQFGDNLQQEGFLFHLLPLRKNDPLSARQSLRLTERFLKRFTPVLSTSQPELIAFEDNHEKKTLATYTEVCKRYAALKNWTMVRKWGLEALRTLGNSPVPLSSSPTDLAGFLAKSGEKEKAVYLLEGMAQSVVRAYRQPQALLMYLDKDYAGYFFKQIREVLDKNQLRSSLVDELEASIN